MRFTSFGNLSNFKSHVLFYLYTVFTSSFILQPFQRFNKCVMNMISLMNTNLCVLFAKPMAQESRKSTMQQRFYVLIILFIA